MTTYICQNCHYKFKLKISGWYPTKECPKCKKIARMEDLIGEGAPAFHRFKEPIAFFRDPKTGEEYARDKRGRKIAIEDTRYDLKKDPHGWKAIGYKTR